MEEKDDSTPQFMLVRSDTRDVEDVSHIQEEETGSSTSPPKRVSRLFDKLKLGHNEKQSTSTLDVPSSPSNNTRNRGRSLSDSLKIFSRSRSNSKNRDSSEYVPENSSGIMDADEMANRLAMVNNGQRSQRSFTYSKEVDDQLQEAIDLHEAGELGEASKKFQKLADPKGEANHPLAQVLYGLGLRHGWGCVRDEEAGFKYLRMAASNSALVEQIASPDDDEVYTRNNKKKGLAKGELVLAIYELGNSFRYGWGCEKDEFAAKTYYETAAKLGDTDAMVDAAWCHLEGFGTKKDKHQAAKYYRMAEDKGRSEVGNSWIWKDKYN